MKKIISLFLLGLLILTGCGSNNSGTNYSQNDLEEASKTIQIGFQTGETLKTILSDITLPTTLSHNDKNYNVSWTSSNVNVISGTGKVTIPDEETKVILTAKVTGGKLSATQTYEAVVLAYFNELAYANSLAYFKNAQIDAQAVLPNSIKERAEVASLLNACTENGYKDDCFTNDTVVHNQTSAYEDIIDTVKAFVVIKKYSQMIEDAIPQAGEEVTQNKTYNIPSFGKFKLRNTNSISRNSYTFVGGVDSKVNGVTLKLSMQSVVSYNETTEEFSVKYTFDITAGYSFFGLSVYQLTAEVIANNMYQLKELSIGTSIFAIGNKLTKLNVIEDRTAIELFSYRDSKVSSDYKSYIYANNTIGYSYYWTNGYFSSERSSFEIFTPTAKIYELNLKGDVADEVGAAKFYFSGMEGYTNVDVDKNKILGVPTGYWKYKLTFTDRSTMIHSNNPNTADESFRIEREDAYSYVEKTDNNGVFTKFDRVKSGQDSYYVMVNKAKFSKHGSLYELPTSLSEKGLTFAVNNIESKINTIKNRLNSLVILNSKIFDDAPGSEKGAKITVTIPGINKTIQI